MKNKTDLSRASLAGSAGKAIQVSHIAAKAGVSASLVSAFLSGKNYSGRGKPGIRIGRETAARIRAVCRELRYVPARQAACNRIYPELGDIVFMINRQTAAFRDHRIYSLLIDGMLTGASDNEILVNLAQYEPEVDYMATPEKIPLNLLSGDITKVVLGGGRPNESLVNALLERGCTIAHVMRDPGIPGVISIVPDYYNATRIAVEYLLRMGHRRIGCAAYSYMRNSYIGQERRRGLEDGFRQTGSEWNEERLVYVDSHSAALEAPAVLERFLQLKEPPTALLCFYDRLAEHLMHASVARGLKLPHDLSIVGCNDDDFSADLTPSLTTIHIPAYQIGLSAVRELNRVALEGYCPDSATVTLPVHLVERQSVTSLEATSGIL